MKEFLIPYGKSFLQGRVKKANLLGIYHSSLPSAAADAAAEVEKSLDNPLGTPKLEELAQGKKRAVIIASDHTRPVPSRIIMPALLRRLRTGNPMINITILIATGCHRSTTQSELVAKFGEDICRNEKIVVHDCDDQANLVELPELPSKGKLLLNKLALEADLLLAEGFIEPHFFAGFSGGRKSVLPGIAGRETVLVNHCSEFIQSPQARTGVLEGNPIHKDMVFAARKAGLAFILNVVVDAGKNIVRSFAGDMELAHAAGCEFLKTVAGIQVPQADIAVTGNGGYPLDQNVYQCVKGMTAGEAVCREQGVIILCAACNDGHGGEEFYRILNSMESAEKLWKCIGNIPRKSTTPDQWQYQILARILKRFTVIVVTDPANHAMIQAMQMRVAASLDEALEEAYRITGQNAQVAIIPDGVSVIAEKI